MVHSLTLLLSYTFCITLTYKNRTTKKTRYDSNVQSPTTIATSRFEMTIDSQSRELQLTDRVVGALPLDYTSLVATRFRWERGWY